MSGRNNGNQGEGAADEGWRSIPDREIWESWGSKTNFMMSYGLKPTPEGFADARALLDSFKQNDWADRQEEAKAAAGRAVLALPLQSSSFSSSNLLAAFCK
ncbi:hypothetical protein BGZ70_006339 [Mortierella alpina]|uniref:Uncharacterized protein n=1 Tax=Mortierella alpina TaxID=64518 RepID=A0A9P6M3U1_MORAP|nr:hypothetical protein BGZ70_006339 [Mortierella alpina]